ncbi:MAG TPA: hypothetical protein DHW77_04420 [Verrucomicrobiales bacterium]|nr:hypothetical protein [Verrucomicrobiales bacterium]
MCSSRKADLCSSVLKESIAIANTTSNTITLIVAIRAKAGRVLPEELWKNSADRRDMVAQVILMLF